MPDTANPGLLRRVVYVSDACVPAGTSPAEMLADILEVARRNNARLGVTGALLHSDRQFAQVLEGPAEAVEAVFEAIQCDSRHNAVAVLEVSSPPARTFADWSMGYVQDAVVTPADLAAADRILAVLRTAIHNTEQARA